MLDVSETIDGPGEPGRDGIVDKVATRRRRSNGIANGGEFSRRPKGPEDQCLMEENSIEDA